MEFCFCNDSHLLRMLLGATGNSAASNLYVGCINSVKVLNINQKKLKQLEQKIGINGLFFESGIIISD